MSKNPYGNKNLQLFGMQLRKDIAISGKSVDVDGLGLQETILDAHFCHCHYLLHTFDQADDAIAELGRDKTHDGTNRRFAHFLVRWVGFGFPAFHLTHSLAAALVLTNPRCATWGDIRFPFPSFLIQMPRPNGVISYSGDSNELLDVEYIKIHTYTSNPDGVVDWPGSDGFGKLESMKDNIRKTGCEHVDVELGVCDLGVEVLRFCRLRESDDRTLDAWFSDSDYKGLVNKIDHRAILTCARFIVNFCLYLANIGPKESWPKARTKPNWNRKKPGDIPEPSVWIIGREIKLGAHMLAAARSDTDRKGWELAQRFMVRGHWRRQACGPGMTERRLKWIAPYWKGPESATAALTRLYSAQDEIVKEGKT